MGFDAQALLREREWRRCERSCAYFLSSYWRILDKNTLRLKTFDLWPYQLDVLKDYGTERRLLVLKARQIGFTTLTSAYLAWRALFKPDQRLFIISRTQQLAQSVVADMRRQGLSSLPDWLWNHPSCPELLQENQGLLRFSNGSTVESFATRNSPARGRTATVLWLDEWAYFENPEDAWASTVHTTEGEGAQMIATSTARGAGTLFHSQWDEAVAGRSGFTPRFFSWRVVPGRDEKWYASKVASVASEVEMNREHPAEPNEAFLRSGATVFDMNAVARQPLAEGRRGRLVGDVATGVEFKPDAAGPLTVFEEPKTDVGYAIGADPTVGVEGGDYSCAQVLNCRNGNQAAVWHGRVEADVLADEIFKLGDWYNRAFVGVESNGVGLVTLRALRDSGYPALYRRQSVDKASQKSLAQIGWMSTRVTKPVVVVEANVDVRSGALTLRCADTVREIGGFVYTNDAGAMSGRPYDDRVMALVIANHMRRHVLENPKALQPSAPAWSKPWFDAMADTQKRLRNRLRSARGARSDTSLSILGM